MARTRLLAACLVALLLAPTLALAGDDIAARDPEDRKEKAPQAGDDTLKEGGGEVCFGAISRLHFMAPRQGSTCWRASSRWACALRSGSSLLSLTTRWLL